jgi:hypothetical protein
MLTTRHPFYFVAPDLLRAATLALLTVLIWCTIMHRWSAEAWRTPLEYIENPEKSNDVLFYFAEVKAARDGRYWPLVPKKIPELGAPLGAEWGDYPMTEQVLIFVTSLIARLVGIFAACNFMIMFAQVLAALSMYAVCRVLRCHWSWSFAAGVAYGFAPYAFAHGEHHLDLTFYWHVPFCLLVTRWLSVGEALSMRGAKFLFAIAVGFVTGLQNQYYTFMFIQLAALGGLAQWVRRDWSAFLPALAVCASSMLGFLVVSLDAIVFQLLHGRNPGAILRTYGHMEFYALKLVDLFIPFPGHRLFSALAEHYSAIVLLRGEIPPAGYLGLVGIAGLASLAITTFGRLVRKSAPMPLEAAQALWIVLEANVGGLNALLGVFGFYLFRATGRYSIFVLALVLLFLVRQLSRLTKDRPILAMVGAATVVVVVLVDQTPPIVSRLQIERTASAADSDRRFTKEIESSLPPGTMVFQLPTIEFPEDSSRAGYDHFRPYLFSQHLRFSFGAVRGRARDEWVHTLDSVSAEEAIGILTRYGFAAIYVDRAQYQDRGQQLFEGFTKMGMRITQSPRGDLFCVFLNPR